MHQNSIKFKLKNKISKQIEQYLELSNHGEQSEISKRCGVCKNRLNTRILNLQDAAINVLTIGGKI
jgi:hypothetical protein